MTSILSLMTDSHRNCDQYFAAAEQAVHAGNWDEADRAFATFRDTTLAHFEAEESILFPAFEASTGMRAGPTQVMRTEHQQIRRLLENMAADLAAKNADAYRGDAETLLIMIQQHNMKEEGVLYPMCDEHLAGNAGEITARLGKTISGA